MERSLITEYEHLHQSSRYGATAYRALPYILPHLLALKPRSLIDYGCGQSDLALALSRKAGIAKVARYDPAIVEFKMRPSDTFDVLVSVDVLEHIPDDEIDAVAADMAGMCRHAILVIDTGPALTLLSDGRNAHVSQHNGAWWFSRLTPHFPTLRRISISQRHRVAYKTWDPKLPALQHKLVEIRERLVVRHLRRCLNAGRERPR